jgi:predicted negative regulator of RcsB-dependent stress response
MNNLENENINDSFEDKLKEQMLEEKISVAIKNLSKKEPPENLWHQIEEELITHNKEKSVQLFIKNRFSFKNIFEIRKFAIAGSVILFLLIIGYTLFLNKQREKSKTSLIVNNIADSASNSRFSKNPTKTPAFNNKSMRVNAGSKKSEDTEKFDTIKYQQRIDKLFSSLELKKKELDPYLRSIYNERLASVDESIDECKTNLVENGLNTIIRKSLILAYDEKVKILMEILKN